MARRIASALFFLVVLLFGFCAARPINDLQRVIAERDVEKLQYFYNTNMDGTTAAFYSSNSAAFAERVANVISVFCPDPLFEGWTAAGNADGSIQMYAPMVSAISPASVPANQSVQTIYQNILPYIFGGSSQHMVAMPITTIYTVDNVLYAELNATLRQYVTLNLGSGKMPTDITGHYNNKYMQLDDGSWCLKKFNSFNAFSTTIIDPAVISISAQNGNDAELSAFVRPASATNN